MVDSIIRLSSDGTGKAVYTSKINYPIAGTPTDIYIPLVGQVGFWTYQTASINSTCASNKNHLTLFNGVGSGIKIRIQEISAYPHLTAAVVGASCTLQIIGVGAAGTGGTSAVIRKHDTDSPALPSQIVSNIGPTTLTIPADREVGGGSIFVEEASSASSGRVLLFQKVANMQSLTLNEGEGIVIRQTAFVGIGAISINIIFIQD